MRRRALKVMSWLLTLVLGAQDSAVGQVTPTQPAPVQSVESGLVFLEGDSRVSVQAPVLGSFIHLHVSGLAAGGSVTQIFTNPTDEWVSGVYVFPLPEDAAVDRLRLRVGEETIEGRVAEREEAEARYEEARQLGTMASLVQQWRPDTFTVSIANVGPGEEVEVELGLHFQVRFDDGRFERCHGAGRRRLHSGRASGKGGRGQQVWLDAQSRSLQSVRRW